MLNRFCITDSCTIEPVPNRFCITDSCTIEPVPNRFCRTDSCTIEPVLNRSCMTVSCIIEPVSNRFHITDSCTIEPVLNHAVSNRYGARLFSCTIGPCPIGSAESEPCKIVPCLIDTIPFFFLLNVRGVFWTPKRKFSLLLELRASNFFFDTPYCTRSRAFLEDLFSSVFYHINAAKVSFACCIASYIHKAFWVSSPQPVPVTDLHCMNMLYTFLHCILRCCFQCSFLSRYTPRYSTPSAYGISCPPKVIFLVTLLLYFW